MRLGIAAFAISVGFMLWGYCLGYTAGMCNEIRHGVHDDRLAAKDEQLASYRLYSSEIAKSLVDLNIQLRERTNECERLQRENMRLERRAMGLSGGG